MLLAGVVAAAAPVVLAAMGETLTEKAGVINLSLDGTIVLAAMAAFAVAYETQSLVLGFGAGAIVGAAVAAVVAGLSIYGAQSQVAVGFVLTLMTKDLAYFLGNPYARLNGPQVAHLPLPGLSSVPVLGPGLFSHNLPVYFSFATIFLLWWFLYRTAPGLNVQAIGENPKAAFVRGLDPSRRQALYSVCGGILVGLAGASFSLCTKVGWGRPQGAEGTGWITLALVIFGGWNPLRVAAGAYLFGLLQVLGIHAQTWLPSVPAQVFQTAPFPLMILTLVLINLARRPSLNPPNPNHHWGRLVVKLLAVRPPAALGRPFRGEC